ncbi:hypothetical protein L9G74_14095 [Shewanella sp. C32]|uniref:ABC transporter permease n=1 Tax=Shewanella electrica TaxID=515560 RepID=A0ABT2FMK5_9GAMM|nr:hypothetical protein [Shewanella electrica]MCH1926054.1 hypothetical protein [Shewanella electrica]MCS4557577.1 hypothetical protein [Shewanella electrica]
MQHYRRYRRSSQLLVWALVALLITLAFIITQPAMLSWVLSSPLMVVDEFTWGLSIAGVAALLLMVWCAVVFSLLALATLVCAAAAVSANLLWPLALILLALWGFNRALQQS